MYHANATAVKSLQTAAGTKRRPKVSLLKRLVTEAVRSDPAKGLVLRDIYCYVQQHSSEYTDSDVVWHKNVRFLLSSNEYFVKTSERNPNGSGFYWKFDDKIYQQTQERAETKRTKARIIPVNTQNELSEAKSDDQRRSSVSRPPYWPMNSDPMSIEQKDFDVCQESRDIASYPLVNVSDIQSPSHPSAESGYSWPDRGTPNAWNQIPSFSQRRQRHESSSSSLEQYHRFPVSSDAGGNTWHERCFSLSSACRESAIFQRETPRFPSAPCSVGERLPRLSHQYAPSHLQRMSRGSYDDQVSDASRPFSDHNASVSAATAAAAAAAAAAHSTRADCAFQTGPSLYAQSMRVYISQDPLNSSGRMIARSLRSYDESSFLDRDTHQAWPYSSNQCDETPQFGDSFEMNRLAEDDQIGYRHPPIHDFNYTPYFIN